MRKVLTLNQQRPKGLVAAVARQFADESGPEMTT